MCVWVCVCLCVSVCVCVYVCVCVKGGVGVRNIGDLGFRALQASKALATDTA